MKLIRKKSGKIKIVHNRKLFWVIILLLIILAFLVYLIFRKSGDKSGECKISEDCVPSSCCHPNSCTSLKNVLACDKVICSMECSGQLDCGAGSCACVRGECKVIPN